MSFQKCALLNDSVTCSRSYGLVFLIVLRKKSLEGIKRKRQQEGQGSDNDEVEDPGKQDEQEAAEESEDEAEYYRQAVGEEPDEGIICFICWLAFAVICSGKHVFFISVLDMFPGAKRKHGPGKSPRPFKKRKMSPGKAPPKEKQTFKTSDRRASATGKRFADKKIEGKSRFNKSEGGKKFAKKGERENRFAGKRTGAAGKRTTPAGKKPGAAGKKFGAQKAFKGRAVVKRQKAAGGKKDFKHKKGKS